MDDTCAVCAESLECVAYGACGHCDVCSTCVIRLRFICDDRHCCICKTESDVVFITRALGDYTRKIQDFSIFPSGATEGKNGSYWYHEDTKAYFDDFDHYSMVKAMCRLSCRVCDSVEDQPGDDGQKRKPKFRNIEQLKCHLGYSHRLFMCNLCLEGRKAFICEQKLYTKAQLHQHIRSGDSEVDGTESERGGFMGHPMCEFCRKPLYGEAELYTHMSTQHYSCHICQRRNPGKIEYYRNYDDLERHFSSGHFLCENEECLAKKFVVFPSESELKRHNATEHGGHMSRSKRNAALQLPTSFTYRRNSEQDLRRGRGRGFQPDSSENELSRDIQTNSETSNTDDSSSNAQTVPDQREVNQVEQIVAPVESTVPIDSRYRQALRVGFQNSLQECSFPPLPVEPTGIQQTPNIEGLGRDTLAARLRRQNTGTRNNVLSSAQTRPTPNRALAPSSSSLPMPVIRTGSVTSSYASAAQTRSAASASGTARTGHSTSVPNVAGSTSLGTSISSMSEFPPVSATQKNKLPASSQLKAGGQPKEGAGHTANKSLVESIRSALDCDENRFTAFKAISKDFRLGVIGTAEYLSYVQEYGLTHLVFELAGLCPDSQKQRELLETYNASVRAECARQNGSNTSNKNRSNQGKGKKIAMN